MDARLLLAIPLVLNACADPVRPVRPVTDAGEPSRADANDGTLPAPLDAGAVPTDAALATDAAQGGLFAIPYVNPTLRATCSARSVAGVDSPLPRFRKELLHAQPGAGYVLPRDLDGDGYPELLLSTLTEGLDLSAPGGGPPLAYGGAYVLARSASHAPGTVPSFDVQKVFDREAQVAWPNASAHFDVDNDGVPDWVIGAGFLVKPTGAVVWMKGTLDGRFGAPQRFAIVDPSCWYHEALPFDLDGDGDLDFVSSCHVSASGNTAGQSRLEWFENPGDGSGGFTQHALGGGGGALVTQLDLDGDGDQDILAPQFFEGDSLVWFENRGSARFDKHVIDRSTGRGFITRLADVNGDGRTDIVYGNHNNELADAASARTMGIYWFEIPRADKLQTLPDWSEYRHTVYEGFMVDGDGNGQSAGAPGMLNVADLDGDCDIDITASGDGDLGLYAFVQGANGFSPLTLDRDPGNVNSGEQHVFDVDGDGDGDIVWAVFGPNDPGLLLTVGLQSKVLVLIQE